MAENPEVAGSSAGASLVALRSLAQKLITSGETHDPMSATLDAIAGALGIGRACYLRLEGVRTRATGPSFETVCVAHAAGPLATTPPLERERVERWLTELSAVGILHGSAEDLPLDADVFAWSGATLLAVLPVHEDTHVDGLLLCLDDRPRRSWERVELETLQAAVQIMGAAMAGQRTLQKLRHKEQLLQEAQEIAHIGYFEKDFREGAERWSDETYRIFGYLPGGAQASLDLFLSAVHEEDRARVERYVRRGVADGAPGRIQHRIVRPDGSVRFVQSRARFLLDDAGRPARVIGTHQDVTDLVRTREELVRVSDQLRQMTERVPAIVFRRVVRSDGSVHYPLSVGSLFPMLGVDPVSMAEDPTTLLRHIHPDDVEGFRARVRDRSRTAGQHEFRILAPDGRTIWLRASFRARTGDDGDFVAEGVVLDVTEEKQLEEQLRQAQKLEAVGRLTGGIAHDFNNLLSVILVNARLVRAAVADGRDPTSELEDLEEAALSGAHLVKGLLGFSRRAELVLKPIDLAESVVHMGHLLKRLVPETIDLRLVASVGAGVALADLAAVQQILMNLVTNARDAMPDGGRLLIEVDSEDFTGSHPDTGEEIRARPFATIVVQDSGTGIEPETLRRVFEPFFSTKEPGKGSGLGMGVVHGLVRQHDGFVQITSEPGKSTRVKVHLPMSRSEETTAPSGTPPRPASEGGGELILLVEDQEALRRTTERTLTRLGYRVVAAEDGVEALERFRTHGEPFDLVLSDVVMPRMGGFELCAEIRVTHPDARFLLVSGYADMQDEGRGLPADVYFAPKPWTLEELSQAVRDALAGGEATPRPERRAEPQTTSKG